MNKINFNIEIELDDLVNVMNSIYCSGYEDASNNDTIHTISHEELVTILRKHNDLV